MPCLEVQIPAADGRSNGTLHLPGGGGPWPGVLVFPDAGGVRETFRSLGDRLAGMGHAVLIPDIYYRAGQWAPFDVATLFTDDNERARMRGQASVFTTARSKRLIRNRHSSSGFNTTCPFLKRLGLPFMLCTVLRDIVWFTILGPCAMGSPTMEAIRNISR